MRHKMNYLKKNINAPQNELFKIYILIPHKMNYLKITLMRHKMNYLKKDINAPQNELFKKKHWYPTK